MSKRRININRCLQRRLRYFGFWMKIATTTSPIFRRGMTIWRLGEKAGGSRFFHVWGSEIDEQSFSRACFFAPSSCGIHFRMKFRCTGSAAPAVTAGFRLCRGTRGRRETRLRLSVPMRAQILLANNNTFYRIYKTKIILEGVWKSRKRLLLQIARPF